MSRQKRNYVDAFFANLNWSVMEKRFEAKINQSGIRDEREPERERRQRECRERKSGGFARDEYQICVCQICGECDYDTEERRE